MSAGANHNVTEALAHSRVDKALEPLRALADDWDARGFGVADDAPDVEWARAAAYRRCARDLRAALSGNKPTP